MPRSRDIEKQKMGMPDTRRRARRGHSEPADWALASGEAIVKLVCAVSARGGAVRFGYTSDGGAYAIGIYGDGEPYTEYIRPSEDVDEVLAEMTAPWLSE